MGKGAKITQPPPAPDPVPVIESVDVSAAKEGDVFKARRRRQFNYDKTLLAGGLLGGGAVSGAAAGRVVPAGAGVAPKSLLG